MATEYHDPRGTKKVLPLDSIILDPRLQLREKGEDQGHIADLEEAIEAGKELPPVEIREVAEEGNYCTDGHHTILARRNVRARKGKNWSNDVQCVVRKGSFTDALIDAARANAEHNALKRTAMDKRNQVVKLLRALAEAGIKWSSRVAGKHVGVSHSFVEKIAAELAQADAAMKAAKESKGKTTGADGKERAAPHKAPKAQTRTKTPEEDIPSIDGTWRQMPPTEAFDMSSHDQKCIAQAKIVTTGQLFDALVGGGVPGIGGYTVQKLVEAIKKMSGFDGIIPEVTRELYDWVGFEADIGRVARRINECANATGGQNDDSDKMHAAWKGFHTLYEAWKADLIHKHEQEGSDDGSQEG